MLCSRNILKTTEPMALARVRELLAPHIGKRIIVRTDSNGGYSYIIGTLGRYGDHIGLDERAGGWEPHEVDEHIAGLYQLLWNPEKERGWCKKPYIREAVPNYTVSLL